MQRQHDSRHNLNIFMALKFQIPKVFSSSLGCIGFLHNIRHRNSFLWNNGQYRIDYYFLCTLHAFSTDLSILYGHLSCAGFGGTGVYPRGYWVKGRTGCCSVTGQTHRQTNSFRPKGNLEFPIPLTWMFLRCEETHPGVTHADSWITCRAHDLLAARQ